MTVKTITGTYASGYTLAAKYSALSITNTGSVASVAGVAGLSAGASGGSGGAAVTLPSGGSLVNAGAVHGGAGGAADPNYNGSIVGSGGAGGAGISCAAVGTVTNDGVIVGGAGGYGVAGGFLWVWADNNYYGPGGVGGSGGAGIAFSAGGDVTNNGTIIGGAGGRGGTGVSGANLSSSQYAIAGDGISIAGVGEVTNDGVISSAWDAIYMSDGGSVINGSATDTTAAIEAPVASGAGGALKVVNFGAISAVFAGALATVTNLGAIGSVRLLDGGTVTNGSAADVTSILETVYGNGVPTTITNFGTIAGLGTITYSSVHLNAGGLVTNGSATDTRALINGYVLCTYSGGIGLPGGAGTVINFGTIVSKYHPIEFKDNGNVANGSTLDRVALLNGGVNILGEGLLTNYGTIFGGADNRIGPGYGYAGVGMANGGALTNAGVIVGGAGLAFPQWEKLSRPANAGGDGVQMTRGGSMTNTGRVVGGRGGYGVHSFVPIGGGAPSGGGAGGVGGSGLYLAGAARVSNTGVITGGAGGLGGGGGNGAKGGVGGDGGAGVHMAADASLTNTGAIKGGAGGGPGADGGVAGPGGNGVDLVAGGSVINGAKTVTRATISGIVGIYASSGGSATVTNYGSIDGVGGVAVKFTSSGDRLIAESGSTFIGAVQGGAGTLELASGAGTITGLGATGTVSGAEAIIFSGFGLYQLDSGSSWTLSGVNTLANSLINSGSLSVSGTLLDEGSLTNSVGGVITVGNGSAVQAQGAVTNAGVIALASTGSDTDLRSTGATLSGGGQVIMSGPLARILGASASASLVNVDNTISGAGFIGLGQLALLVNDAAAVIDATAPGGIILRLGQNTSTERITNDGLLEASAGSVLTIGATRVDDEGGGAIQAASGGRVDLQDALVNGGSLKTTGSGIIESTETGSALDGSGFHPITLAGTLDVADDTSLTVVGSIINQGVMVLRGVADRTDLAIGAGGVVLSGGGVLEMDHAVDAIDTTATSGATTLANLDNRISGAGTIGDADLTLINEAKGFIYSNSSKALVLDTGANTIVNVGIIEGGNGAGGLTIESPLDNTGQLIAYEGDLTIKGAVNGAGTARLAAGTLSFGSAFSQNVTFGGGTSQLILADSRGYAGTITGFSRSGADAMDLKDINFVSAGEATFKGTAGGGVLTVTDGNHKASIKLTGDYLGSTFVARSDGHGGTIVTDPVSATQLSRSHVAAFAGHMATHAPPAGAPTCANPQVSWHDAQPTTLGRPA